MFEIDNRDLLVEEEITPDADDEFVFGPATAIVLKNFDHNSIRNELLDAHRTVLRERVAPFLKNNRLGFAEIYAMTDRSGTRGVNYRVAGKRLSMVQNELLALGVPFTKVFHGFAKAIGEDFWESKSNQDGGRDPIFRDDGRNSSLRSVALALAGAPLGIPTRDFRRPLFRELLRFCRQHVQQRV